MALYSSPPSVGADSLAMDKLHERLEQALHAHHRFRRDQHYMVDKDKIVIIDESTGRRMPDRHWREGLHQAVEAKEGVPIHGPIRSCGPGDVPELFPPVQEAGGHDGHGGAELVGAVSRLQALGGVRADQSADDPRALARPRRADGGRQVRRHRRPRWCICGSQGRSVLIGTRSVDKSEELSRRLTAAGIEHQVLNARQHEQEAKIIAQAGMPGRVTIATNMAGRGTDIKPAPEVIAAGGLHVIGTERHEALRIDRQLSGRAGRQGDPGSGAVLPVAGGRAARSAGRGKARSPQEARAARRRRQLGRLSPPVQEGPEEGRAPPLQEPR